MKNLTIYLISLLLFSLSLTNIQAQQGEVGQNVLKFKDRGNRLEGLVGKDISRSSLDLVSATVYKEPFGERKGQNLHMKFYLPESEKVDALARQLCGNYLYRMKPHIQTDQRGWYDFYPWPVDAVLAPIELDAFCLGVLVRLKGNDKVIVPSIIYHKQKPNVLDSYTFSFQCLENISDIKYDLFKGDFREKGLNADSRILNAQLENEIIDGGEVIRIDIDLNSTSLSRNWKGWMALRIRARKAATEEKIRKIYYFYHITEGDL